MDSWQRAEKEVEMEAALFRQTAASCRGLEAAAQEDAGQK